jgi:hypothetical protein
VKAGTVLTLVARGTPQALSNVEGSVPPFDTATIQPEQGETISAALRDKLVELGIYARDLSNEEIIEYLVGRALYDDVPYKLLPEPKDNTVATNRLPYSPVLPIVDSYEKLFYKMVVVDGKSTRVGQDSAIKHALEVTWDAYSSEPHKGRLDPKGFRAFLEKSQKKGPEFAAALADINGVRDLLSQVENLGLTSNEFKNVETALIKRVRPSNIRESDMIALINSPSSLQKNAVASR